MANQDLIPNLSGVFGMYCVNLQRALVENNCSSIVMLTPSLYNDMLFSTNLFHTSETKANLSVCKRVDLLLRKSKQNNRRISQKRFLAIVSGKTSRSTAYSRSCPKEHFFHHRLPSRTAKR